MCVGIIPVLRSTYLDTDVMFFRLCATCDTDSAHASLEENRE